MIKINKTPKVQHKKTSTVGRGKAVTISHEIENIEYEEDFVHLFHGNSLDYYETWPTPNVIISDGAYGVLGFEGDTSDHLEISNWYEPHIKCWSESANPNTTLWFWNSEIGWASVHPVLEKYGWLYINANIWNKTKSHIAGNINTAKIRRFPVVTEMCVQYAYEGRINGKLLKNWLYDEWKRTGLPFRRANEACNVKDVAVRKYFDQGHLWYFPPPKKFEMIALYANKFGARSGRPYFSKDGRNVMTAHEWLEFRTPFNCPHGYTNVWERPPLKGPERIKVNGSSGKAVHLNQKPLDLMKLNIDASSKEGDIIWEPFGGLFSASYQARNTKRQAYSCETDPTYFHFGVQRFINKKNN